MPETKSNLFNGLSVPVVGEVFEDLLLRGPVRIERIVSSAKPESGEYDQAQDEWVLLLQGKARLLVEGAEIALESGDTLYIPAHTKHRVLSTSERPPCVWLAVHIDPTGWLRQDN